MSEISDKRKLLRELKEIKGSLSYDMDRDYSRIYNACVDIDNTYGDWKLTDYIQEQNFVNDDDMEYLIERNKDSIDRLRYFIGNTYSAELYRIDGYGNLANVERSDLECLCDELIDMVRDDIKQLKQAEL